jgi:putative membrane protein
MSTASAVLVALIAALHVYILVLEMFLWTTKRGQRAFGMTAAQAQETATLAKNQGLYNGFLAAGLAWSLVAADPAMALQLKTFFLGCVAVAGVFGAATAARKILFIQTVPAVIALAVTWLAHPA